MKTRALSGVRSTHLQTPGWSVISRTAGLRRAIVSRESGEVRHESLESLLDLYGIPKEGGDE